MKLTTAFVTLTALAAGDAPILNDVLRHRDTSDLVGSNQLRRLAPLPPAMGEDYASICEGMGRRRCRRNPGCVFMRKKCMQQYFLVDTEGFNCKNQALDYIKDADMCMEAAKILGVKTSTTADGSASGVVQKYCGTSGRTASLTFRGDEGDGNVLHAATETKFQICRAKKSPWMDEKCGRELCIPDVLKTSDPKKFDFSQIVWKRFGNAVAGFKADGTQWPEGAALYKMTEDYLPHFHYHTNFHSGWILDGAKKTFGLQHDGSDDKWIKPLGTYFAVDEMVWHTEERTTNETIIYLRFVEFFDYIYPDPSNKKWIVTGEESGLAEVKTPNSNFDEL